LFSGKEFFVKVVLTLLLAALVLPVAFGQTWEAMGPEGGSFCAVIVDPADADNIKIVGASPSPADVYHSTDGGASWTVIGNVGIPNVYTVSAFDWNTIYAQGYDPNTGQYVVASSLDGGVTWTSSPYVFDGYPNTVCAHPTDVNKVYTAGYYYDYGTATYIGKFWASTDGGATFTETILPDGIYDGAIVTGMGIAPTNPDNMMITGYQYDASYNYFALTWHSLDGGVTWTDISAQVDPDPYGEMWAIMYDPTDENVIHGGGWYYTHSTWDGGATWTRHPMEMLGAEAGDIDPSNTDIVYVGNGDHVYKSTDQGHTWTDITGGFGGYAGDITVCPSMCSTVYQANPYGGNFKSLDHGQTWESAHSGIMASSLTCVGTAPSAPNTVFGTTLGGQLFGSYDSCENLVELTYPPACTVGNFSDIVVCSTDPDIVMGLAVG
jgi:photosystem II stability/assembly factor-like uncharacterized protein